ncbi:UDP-3-O-(3-hydroxymyristoyl)glucosamine N-acyltransferase [Anthocerotibacter panamensis]|uniref:UDP-3-O-(3-hydroxymyristoyl)glucosamine N-acyltransferase n=1 Tax=Anthocerotibacter panamensis TaxID=2857077 RepID=UPI001C403319|nr:UDP-3-O-(3-hydroxymyristoyl)glucosamine N-acyltransferase [Anthocerotibacter panamensis]
MTETTQPALSVTDLARLLEGEVVTATDILVKGIAEPDQATPHEVAFLLDQRTLDHTKAGVLVTAKNAVPKLEGNAHIRVANTRVAFAQTLAYFYPQPVLFPLAGIHPQATVDPKATVHPDTRIGAGAYVGPGAVIGAGTTLFPGVYVGAEVRIGVGCILYPQSVVLDRCILGDRVILNSGAVIGGDGFGFATTVRGHLKIPHVGNVVLEDEVEIGANTAIDRATLKETRVGRGTKIDNLVMIGHNAQVGQDCLMVSQSGIAGSTQIGDRTIIAAQAGVASTGHLEIGSDSVIYGRAGVHRSFPQGSKISGFPAQDHRKELRQQVSLTHVPDLLREVRTLTQRLQQLEAELAAVKAAQQ